MYNNKNEFDFLFADLWNIQNYFPGVEKHAGTLINYPFPGAGTISLFYYLSKSNSPPLPGWGGLHWLVHYTYVRNELHFITLS
jgi:hypothetical protein